MNELVAYSQYPTIMSVVQLLKYFFFDLLSCLSVKNKNIDIIITKITLTILLIVLIDSTKRKYLIFD